MPDTKESMQESKQAAGALADALQDLLRQLIDRIVGKPTQGRGGEPLRDVCYLVMPMGEPIDPRDVSFPWDPSGGSSSGEIQDDGKFGAAEAQAAAQPAPATPPATPAPDGAGTPATPPPPQIDIKLQHAFMAARKTAEKFDRMLRVTSDGSYRTSRIGGGKVSSAYEAVITKAQGIPAPPPPPEIQKQIDEAMRILYVFDENGKQKGKTKEFKNYQMLKEAYADAEAEYANANSAAMTNAALGQSWPVTSKALRARVDNAYDDWRSADAERIENALETVKSVGGAIGSHFLAQARALYDAWNLGLAGSVAVGIPYTEVMPGSWYDPDNTDNGFTGIHAASSQYQNYRQSRSGQAASSWYSGHCASTRAGGGGFLAGVVFGASGGSTSSSQDSGSSSSGSSSSSFSNTMSNVSIDLEYGLCTIYRPWLLRELFTIDGWYLPGEKENTVSDGTVGGQAAEDEKHLLPMIPTQFLVVRNVKITADGWGDAGTRMSQYSKEASAESDASRFSMSGGAGFLFLGGAVSRSSADWSGSESESSAAAGSCYFTGDANHGTLTVHGGQIVAWVGEIVPASPRVDGTKQAAADGAAQPGATPAPAPAPSPAPAPAPTPAPGGP